MNQHVSEPEDQAINSRKRSAVATVKGETFGAGRTTKTGGARSIPYEAADMRNCACKSSKTGGNKKQYQTQPKADIACEELRARCVDGDTLNTYYCVEGKCWH